MCGVIVHGADDGALRHCQATGHPRTHAVWSWCHRCWTIMLVTEGHCVTIARATCESHRVLFVPVEVDDNDEETVPKAYELLAYDPWHELLRRVPGV